MIDLNDLIYINISVKYNKINDYHLLTEINYILLSISAEYKELTNVIEYINERMIDISTATRPPP